MVGRRAEQTLVVGIAAHDSMEDDHIGGLDVGRVGGDVVEAPLRTLLEAVLLKEPCPLLLVPGGELEVDGARRASLQELDLQLADAAADLEDARSLDPVLLEERHHALRCLVDPVLAIALGRTGSHPRREERVAATRVAAARHCGQPTA